MTITVDIFPYVQLIKLQLSLVWAGSQGEYSIFSFFPWYIYRHLSLDFTIHFTEKNIKITNLVNHIGRIFFNEETSGLSFCWWTSQIYDSNIERLDKTLDGTSPRSCICVTGAWHLTFMHLPPALLSAAHLKRHESLQRYIM